MEPFDHWLKSLILYNHALLSLQIVGRGVKVWAAGGSEVTAELSGFTSLSLTLCNMRMIYLWLHVIFNDWMKDRLVHFFDNGNVANAFCRSAVIHGGDRTVQSLFSKMFYASNSFNIWLPCDKLRQIIKPAERWLQQKQLWMGNNCSLTHDRLHLQ